MRTKKSFRKYSNKENEDVDKNSHEQCKKFSTQMKNNSNITYNPLFLDEHEEQQQDRNSEDSDLLTQENKSKQKPVDDNFVLSDNTNKSNDIESFEDTNKTSNGLTDPRVGRGEKRRLEEPSNSIENDENQIDVVQLKKKCLELETRIQELEGIWMRYPQHLSMAPNVSNDVLHTINQDNVVMNYNEELLNAIQILNIDANVLLKLKKKTPTATARAILKYKFPRPAANFKLTDVDTALTDAIVCYAKQCHPDDKSSNYKIRKAMSNYFSLIIYNKKHKSMTKNTSIEKQ